MRIVVKVGTHAIAAKSGRPDHAALKRLVAQLCALRKAGDDVFFVSSGAVAAGVESLGLKSRPKETTDIQMCAAVGQARFISEYEKLFAARDVKLFRHPDPKNPARESIGIEANVSLAPFDLGIFQKFRMYSQEFEIKGIDEVVVDLRRIGGTPDSWVRSNRAFASELREQFLLWRSLPIGTIEHYRSETKKTLGLS